MFTQEQVYKQLKQVTIVDEIELCLGGKFLCVLKTQGETQGVLVTSNKVQRIVDYFKNGLSRGKQVTVTKRTDIQGMLAWVYSDGTYNIQIYKLNRSIWGY